MAVPPHKTPNSVLPEDSAEHMPSPRPKARRRKRRGPKTLAARFAPPLLLVGAVAGAFFGGRALRDMEIPIVAARQAAVPLAASLAQVAENGGGQGSKRAAPPSANPNEEASRATLETVYSLVKEHYVDELPSDRVLTRGAVRALLQSLNDPNSQFLEPSQRALIENEAKGTFAGIGASLAVKAQKENGYTEYRLVVVAPLPGSPAEAAGLRAGDVITHVGGKWVLGYDPLLKASKIAQKVQVQGDDNDAQVRQTYEAARARLRGGIGLFAAQMALKGDGSSLRTANLPTDKVTLTVQRGDNPVSAPLSFSVPLRETRVEAVMSKSAGQNVGYVKINRLDNGTKGDVENALQTVPHTKGLIVDLRNAPGGAIDAAQSVEAVLPFSPVTETKNSLPFGYEMQGRARHVVSLSAASPQTDTGAAAKIVVLINEGTASSAEALASALQNRHGATLMGTRRTFGDALAQTLYPLPDGSAFTLTTGEWLDGRKQSWANRGLTPTVLVSASARPAVPLETDLVLARAIGFIATATDKGVPVRHASRAARPQGAKGNKW